MIEADRIRISDTDTDAVQQQYS